MASEGLDGSVLDFLAGGVDDEGALLDPRGTTENDLVTTQAELLNSLLGDLGLGQEQTDALRDLMFAELGITTSYTEDMRDPNAVKPDKEKIWHDLEEAHFARFGVYIPGGMSNPQAAAQLEAEYNRQMAEYNKGAPELVYSREISEEEQNRQEIERLWQERELAALRGDLPVSAALEREIAEGRAEKEAALLRQFGEGWQTSTPAMQAMQDFEQSALELREGARFGTLAQAEQIGGARELRNATLNAQMFNQMAGVNSLGMPYFNAGVQLSNAFQGPLTRLLQERVAAASAGYNAGQLQLGRRGQNIDFASDVIGSIFGGVMGG